MQFRDNPTETFLRDPGNIVLQSLTLEDPPSSKSTARLAAEAAFSGSPVQPSAAQQPLIVVRRKRFAVPSAPDRSQSCDGRPPDGARGPRGFRAVAPVVFGLPERQVSPSLAQAGRSGALEALKPTPLPSARQERLAHKKPSKVLRIVFESADEQGTAQGLDPAELLDQSGGKLDSAERDQCNRLMMSIEDLKLSLAKLKQLKAFSLKKSGYARDWLKIERRMAAIRQQLQVSARQHDVASGQHGGAWG
ncbi:hypothetical protein [Piscinibacter koreensis]|uniref:Uncharacterized protein n=1 Tax=Piscinibacter koreensis TaxID=2742824 RepID=A0A7Y6NSG0_9BURK|nr:hypothetical protein [Schlegelella koreensis]NUZ08486.1 hypothetical protein [Schlegelella koreensis]